MKMNISVVDDNGGFDNDDYDDEFGSWGWCMREIKEYWRD